MAERLSASSSGDDPLWEEGRAGAGPLERDCPWLPAFPRSHPKPQRGDEAAQRTCAGLLSYYTWATPVTVKATPSAVSTSSQRGCNVIISREILPRNAKQGPWVWGPRAWGAGKDFDISLRRQGQAGGSCCRRWRGGLSKGLELGACEEEKGGTVGLGCRWLSGRSVVCQPCAHVSSAHISLAGRVGEEAEESSGVVWPRGLR